MTDVEKQNPEWGNNEGSDSDTDSGTSSTSPHTTRKTLTNEPTN